MSPIANYTTTVAALKSKGREMASRLQQLGLPQKIVDKICIWVRGEARRLRDEAREHSH